MDGKKDATESKQEYDATESKQEYNATESKQEYDPSELQKKLFFPATTIARNAMGTSNAATSANP